ncbi:MAG: hypothetical protein RR248_02555 [Clostridia bacterium]
MQENANPKENESTSKTASKSKKDWQNAPCLDSVKNVNNIKILSAVYSNALMAKDTTEFIVKKVSNMELADLLRKQVNKYEDFARNAQIQANTFNCILKDELKAARNMAKFNLNMKLMADNSITSVAKIIILGTTNGVIDLGRLLHHTNDISEKVNSMIKDLLGYEESVVESMKYYL